MTLTAGENDKNRRLDRILRKALPHYPLPLIHKMLRLKQVLVDGKPGKARDRVDCGASISIPSLDDSQTSIKKINNTGGLKSGGDKLTESMIIWEGEGLLAVNKPPGLEVHSQRSFRRGKDSLESMVCSFLSDKLPPSLSFRPGPLHRLDKPSSGIVVFSVNLEGARLFSSLLRERKIKKTYLAIVEGVLEKENIWRDRLVRDKKMKKTFISDDGKTAITKVTPLQADGNYSLIQAQIVTGRTHQIRAQAAAHGFPLAGDAKYGGKKQGTDSFFLHAWKLEFLEYSIKAPCDQFLTRSVSSNLRKTLNAL